ncbi:four helix bundle protein [Patescibacteria group bacterium]|nr:four helix bundle protein [Patescibacteria group bacterium]
MRRNSILIQKADKLAHEIYRISRQFPKEELFGLTSQIRRAVISVPLNAIEGFARQSEKEYRRFLEISYGSLKEVKYLLYFAYIEKYICKKDYDKILDLSEEIGKILWTIIQKLKN